MTFEYPLLQATVKKDLDLENIHSLTPYATQHVLKFQGIDTLCACPYSRVMSEKSMFVYSGIDGLLFPTDKI